jgi:methylmalonic aciduria homocystinuria type C protein
MGTCEGIVSMIRGRCLAGGLDLVQPFAVSEYNRAVGEAHRLPDFGRPRSLAVLVGNSRALWAPFVEVCARSTELLEHEDPLERYVMTVVSEAAADAPARTEVVWAHDTDPVTVAIRRAAEVSGLAYPSPTGLCVHPVYGPWIALRAVVVVDVEAQGLEPRPLADPCPADCARECGEALRRITDPARVPQLAHADIKASWRDWVAVRDACKVGVEHRYSEAQIRYHYTKDRSLLVREVAARRA